MSVQWHWYKTWAGRVMRGYFDLAAPPAVVAEWLPGGADPATACRDGRRPLPVAGNTIPAERKPMPKNRRPCVHSGPRLQGEPCGSTLRRCIKLGVVCSGMFACQDATTNWQECESYEVKT